MRDVAKILATLLLLGWLAYTLNSDNAPARVSPDPKWRRTVNGWRELSAWYIPDGQFHDVRLNPIAFAALEFVVVATYLVLMPPCEPARRTAHPKRRRPNAAANTQAGGTLAGQPAASRPAANRPSVVQPGVGRPGVGRLSAAVRPTANRRTTVSHSPGAHSPAPRPARSSRANRPSKR